VWSALPGGNRDRVRRIAVATAVLVGINVLARLLARFALPAGTDPFLPGLASVLAMVIAVAVTGFLWTRVRRVPAVVGDLFFVTVVATLLVTLVGPFVSGHPEFDLGFTVKQIGLCAGLLVVGDAAGVLTAVALGLDPTSRAWQRQAERVRSKPARKAGTRR
jgi:hypothetical protein